MANNPFEIPHDLRVVLDQNVQQAHAAYEQISDLVTNTIRAWMTAAPANPMLTGFQDIQNSAMDFAKENAESVFELAGKISNAKSTRDPGASNPVHSGPYAGPHEPDAGSLHVDRRSAPEAATRLKTPAASSHQDASSEASSPLRCSCKMHKRASPRASSWRLKMLA